jgi:cell shape-determining protein MreC
MPRSLHSSPLARRLLPVSIGILTITAFLPPSVASWPSWFGGLLKFFIAPISQPVRGLAGWLSSAEEPLESNSAIANYELQIEQYRQLLLRSEREIEQYRQQIADLQLARQLNPELPVRLMHAAVIGSSSDLSSRLLWIKAGTSDGVEVNSVATVRGQQLLGKVVLTEPRSCQVQPITSTAAGQIRGVVMLSDLIRGPECLLEPKGDGTLVGPVEDLRQWPVGTIPPPDAVVGDPIKAKVGQTIRLQDQSWPRSSQALFIGVIEKVEPAPNQPLRQVITVRPTMSLERVSEVVLRFFSSQDAGGREGKQ